ncbi:hypothetical protein J9305_18935 (plasmid) [Leptospira interrogans]|nr:hypothetical protein J9305_18935 [Leptospira interrogans]
MTKFGTNPFETGNGYPLNTKCGSKTLGNHPYFRIQIHFILGEVGFGKGLELKIKLDKTKYLSPELWYCGDTGPYQYFYKLYLTILKFLRIVTISIKRLILIDSLDLAGTGRLVQ